MGKMVTQTSLPPWNYSAIERNALLIHTANLNESPIVLSEKRPVLQRLHTLRFHLHTIEKRTKHRNGCFQISSFRGFWRQLGFITKGHHQGSRWGGNCSIFWLWWWTHVSTHVIKVSNTNTRKRTHTHTYTHS